MNRHTYTYDILQQEERERKGSFTWASLDLVALWTLRHAHMTLTQGIVLQDLENAGCRIKCTGRPCIPF